jgi:hypothetical protein
MQLSEPDVGSIEKGSIVFVAHAGCAADMGVVDAWERRRDVEVTASRLGFRSGFGLGQMLASQFSHLCRRTCLLTIGI